MLNIFAILSPDQGGVVNINVERVLPLEGPYELVGDGSGRTRISLFPVRDATVTIFDGTNTYSLKYDSLRADTSYSSGSYSPTDSTFAIQPGRTYDLSVVTPDGLRATGSTTIPAINELLEASIPETLRTDTPLNLQWFESTGFNRISLEGVGEFGDQETGVCVLGYRENFIGDTSAYIELDLCTNRVYELAVWSFDENYYNYFIGGGQDSDYMFFLLGEGREGLSYGLESALGVFGSYRYNSIERPLIR